MPMAEFMLVNVWVVIVVLAGILAEVKDPVLIRSLLLRVVVLVAEQMVDVLVKRRVLHFIEMLKAKAVTGVLGLAIV